MELSKKNKAMIASYGRSVLGAVAVLSRTRTARAPMETAMNAS